MKDLWLDNRTCYIGYIGDDFQKLDIHFEEIDKQTLTRYCVKGKSKVRDNICDFEGFINIKEIRELEELNLGIDDFMQGRVKNEGYIIATFQFLENKKQSGSGMFEGTLFTKWYINEKDEFLYDDIRIDSDSYSNNQFLSTWISYKTKKVKECAWGHYRIPCSTNLDIGAAEFAVNPQYYINGWGQYSGCLDSNKAWRRKWIGKYIFESYNRKDKKSSFFLEVKALNEIKLTIIINEQSPKIYVTKCEAISQDKIKISYGDNQKIVIECSDSRYTISGDPIYFINPGNNDMPLTKLEEML